MTAGTAKQIREWERSGNAALKVAASLARGIASGNLAKWSELPPAHQIADEHDVSARTVYNAKKALAEHGFLTKANGRYYVA